MLWISFWIQKLFLDQKNLDPETVIMDQFLDPENDIMDQFLDPETDIMGEGNFMLFIAMRLFCCFLLVYP